jgi:lysophospholipase-2
MRIYMFKCCEREAYCTAMRDFRRVISTAPRITQSAANLIISPSKQHTSTVIGPIHGLGDTNRGWSDIALYMHEHLPSTKFVLPNAPMMPVTLNGGHRMPSWYDLAGAGSRFEEACRGIDDSRATIAQLVQGDIDDGTPPDRIVIAGFSQGGALALYTGLQATHALAGILVLSGYLAGAPSFKLSPAACRTPVLHCHGVEDQMVRLEWARETESRLRALGHSNYTLNEYDDLGHSARLDEIGDAVAWLRIQLGYT